MTQDLVLFKGETLTKIHPKTGAVSIRLLPAKEWKANWKKEHADASGKQASQAYNAYVREFAKSAKVDALSGALQRGEIGITGVSIAKSGEKGKLDFVFLKAMEGNAINEAKETINNITDPEQLLQLMAALEDKLNAAEKIAIEEKA